MMETTQLAILIICPMVLGYLLSHFIDWGKRMEFRERLKKAIPKKKVKSMGDIGWEAYLSDVNNTHE